MPVPKSRRVLPEHEGKYKITMPMGTTPRTKKILQKKGLNHYTFIYKKYILSVIYLYLTLYDNMFHVYQMINYV